MTKHVALTILLTLMATACSIEPYQTKPTDQTTDTHTDQNEPSNGTPKTLPGAPAETAVELEYLIRCPEQSCGADGCEFSCAGYSGFKLADGASYLCSDNGTCEFCTPEADVYVMCTVYEGAE